LIQLVFASASLISLDYDLSNSRTPNPGDGLDAVNLLNHHKPACPVIVHTSLAAGRKDPGGMAVGFPLFPQEFQRALGQRHVAVAVALAPADVQEPALGIDVAHLQAQAFAQPQAAGVDEGEPNAMIQGGHGGQEAAHLGGGEHHGQLGLVVGAHQLDRGGPGTPQGLLPEKFDGAQGLGGGLAGDFLVAFEVDEILAQLFDGDFLGRLAVMLGKLAEAGEIGLLGAGADGQEFQIIGKCF